MLDEEVIIEAADVGNFAMMIADVCGALGKVILVLEVVSVGVRPIFRYELGRSCLIYYVGHVSLGEAGTSLLHINGFRVYPNGRVLNPSRRGTDGHNYDVCSFAGGKSGEQLRKAVYVALRSAVSDLSKVEG